MHEVLAFMAIMKCPECGNEVSSSADFCPHCGYKLKTNDNVTHVQIDNKVSKIYERNQRHRWIGEIVASVICIILGIVMFCLCGLKVAQEIQSIKITFIICGLIALIGGIIGAIYYSYRLKNY